MPGAGGQLGVKGRPGDVALPHHHRLAAERQADPSGRADRDDLLLRLIGSPDPRQIDGLGGATSLTSKVAVISRSAQPGADVDYLFLQLGVDEPTVSEVGSPKR